MTKFRFFQSKWIFRLSFAYLLLPFILFCLGWLKLYFSLPITGLFIWLYWRIYRQSAASEDKAAVTPKELWVSLAVLLAWVLLSGIGGYAFQNPDFYMRNAILRDLINYSWPVKYPISAGDTTSTYYLIYYFGYWLPSALFGKLFGWQAANAFLLIWTFIGIVLCVLSIKLVTKNSLILLSILLIFFSGMDVLGVIYTHLTVDINAYPTLWPPVTQLAKWGGSLIFNSNTIQLFNIFNQAVPTWLCLTLMINQKDNKLIALIWALCCFFAPIPAIGMFPYVFIRIFNETFHPDRFSFRNLFHGSPGLQKRISTDIKNCLTCENILGGGGIFAVSFLYLSANENASIISFSSPNLGMFILFEILEGLAFWLLLVNAKKHDLNWYLAGFLLLTIPLVKVGLGPDFCLHASIPTLFLLMVWIAEYLKRKTDWRKIVLIAFLTIGSVTPIYEINRSVFRTFQYYTQPHESISQLQPLDESIYIPVMAEDSHPDTLTADLYYSMSHLAEFNVGLIQNWANTTDTSRFFRHFVK